MEPDNQSSYLAQRRFIKQKIYCLVGIEWHSLPPFPHLFLPTNTKRMVPKESKPTAVINIRRWESGHKKSKFPFLFIKSLLQVGTKLRTFPSPLKYQFLWLQVMNMMMNEDTVFYFYPENISGVQCVQSSSSRLHPSYAFY